MCPQRDTRRRVMLVAVVVPVVCLGLVTNFRMDGAVADFAGDALYAVMVYLVAAFVGVRMRPLFVALISVAVCAVIEILQLTGGPAALAEMVPVSRLVLGTGFDPVDLLAYVVGSAAALTCDTVLRKPRAVSAGR